MARVGTDRYQCAACGEVKPRTREHFCIDSRGYVSGYCRPCHKQYLKAYAMTREGYSADEARKRAREWYRKRWALTPDQYRVGVA